MTHTTTRYTTVEYSSECTAECFDYLGDKSISGLTKGKSRSAILHL